MKNIFNTFALSYIVIASSYSLRMNRFLVEMPLSLQGLEAIIFIRMASLKCSIIYHGTAAKLVHIFSFRDDLYESRHYFFTPMSNDDVIGILE